MSVQNLAAIDAYGYDYIHTVSIREEWSSVLFLIRRGLWVLKNTLKSVTEDLEVRSCK